MNYLAHTYFSHKNEGLLIGNMIGDFVKGKQLLQYSESIQKGIVLHRRIDTYTDTHPVILEAKKVFRSAVGRYDGAFLDIAYDYFLANAPYILSEPEWKQMAAQTYSSIESHLPQLPFHFQRMFSYMKKGNWLYNYRYTWQIKQSFDGLIQRAQYLDKTADPFTCFEESFSNLGKSFVAFFPDLETFVSEWIRQNGVSLQ